MAVSSAPSEAGRLITLEGIDGSGKSTQAARLADALRARGLPVLLTREPGGTPGAEAIRRLLLSSSEIWSPETEILLFTAARCDHAGHLLRPALADGHVVLCDRYLDSTRVYQGTDPERRAFIDRLHRETVALDPDLTLLFDIDPELAEARRAARAADADRIEARGIDYQAELRVRFLKIAGAEPARVKVIDAAQPQDGVAAQALAALDAAGLFA
ncbi:MAG: dTMP kinase [Pikeienuella sp.]